MANHYLLFSTMVPCKTAAEKEWWKLHLETSEDEDGERFPPCEYEILDEDLPHRGPGVWVYTEEGGDIERLADLVCLWQKEFGIEEAWSLEFAETCSKPRLDEFCGGAVVCYRGEEHFMHTGLWASEKKKELVAGLKGARQ